MERSRESKLGYSGTPELSERFSSIAARFVGKSSSVLGGFDGS